MSTLLSGVEAKLPTIDPVVQVGQVDEVVGLTVAARGLRLPVGSLCTIRSRDGEALAEVAGFRQGRTLLVMIDHSQGIEYGQPVRKAAALNEVPVGDALLGRVVDAMGHPIDGKGPVRVHARRPLHQPPPHPLRRNRIREPLATGVRAIDGLLTCGKGQRMGIFSGSGVGKSVLLGMIARYTQAPVVVIALVGERGREVREFIERDLGESGLKRSVVVVATSDQSPTLRVRCAFTASAIAEHFRDAGHDVMLLLDSVTRTAYAQRELGLAVGEPPSTKGYPPSVHLLLSRLLERAGQGERGSITGLYTVLVEADDITEPIADAVRSILDGHLWLSRDLAHKGHFPAIDPLMSVSRVMRDVVSAEHAKAAGEVRSLLAAYRDVEDLLHVGAYVRGTNPRADRAIQRIEPIRAFLRQEMDRGVPLAETVRALAELPNASPQAAQPQKGAS